MVKPHGLRGEVIVKLVTDRVERLAPGAVLDTERGPLEVLRSSAHLGRFIVAFAGIDGLAEAEALRGLVLSAAPLDDADALWVHDLVGSAVEDVEGRSYARVVAVEANPASDLLVLEDGGLVPLRFVVSHGPERVVIDPPTGLLD
ncbi:MAG: ribosome maturation factor RimM [Acidimicrobiales bacterium]